MTAINHDWYAANEGRAYPLSDAATLEDNGGAQLPSDIVADLHLKYPREYGNYAFLSAVSVTANLITLTLEAVDDLDSPSAFRPLAAVSVPAEVPIRRHVPLLAQSDGVGGWIVFGRGAQDRVGYRGRFTPRAGLLSPRAARPYRALPVTGIRDGKAGQLLTGLVRLRVEPPLYCRAEDRVIGGVTRKAIVIGLLSGSDGENFLPGENATQDESVFSQFAGPCAGRPESRNCGEPQPIEFINTVGPDCDGQLTLDFRGCAKASPIENGHGIVLECKLGLEETCPPKNLPDDLGSLPNDDLDTVSISDSCGTGGGDQNSESDGSIPGGGGDSSSDSGSDSPPGPGPLERVGYSNIVWNPFSEVAVPLSYTGGNSFQAGDLAFVIGVDRGGGVITAPAGWTFLYGTAGGVTGWTWYVYAKFLDGTEGSGVVLDTDSGGPQMIGATIIVRNGDWGGSSSASGEVGVTTPTLGWGGNSPEVGSILFWLAFMNPGSTVTLDPSGWSEITGSPGQPVWAFTQENWAGGVPPSESFFVSDTVDCLSIGFWAKPQV